MADRALGDPGPKVEDRHRHRDAITLGDVTAEVLEDPPLVLGLDAFGDHFESQPVGELDDVLDDEQVLAVALDVADERAVDLERRSAVTSRSVMNDEYPVPKSSIAILIFDSRNASMVNRLRSVSVASARSVTSSSRRWAGNRVSASTRVTVATK